MLVSAEPKLGQVNLGMPRPDDSPCFLGAIPQGNEYLPTLHNKAQSSTVLLDFGGRVILTSLHIISIRGSWSRGSVKWPHRSRPSPFYPRH